MAERFGARWSERKGMGEAMGPLPFEIGVAFAFALGACVGSFAVAAAWRLPRDISIVTPASFCPNCERPIPWWANVPIFAYIGLRGRCVMCGATIPIRHLLGELAMAFAAATLFILYPPADAAARFLFLTALLICSLIDYDWRLIPNVITIPGTVVGFAVAGLAIPEVGWFNSMLGIAVGGGILYLTGFFYQIVRGREGVGLGDVFLLAMVGAFIGWAGALFTLFFGALIGSIGGIIYAFAGGAEPSRAGDDCAAAASAASSSPAPGAAQPAGKSILATEVPFGPYLSIAAAIFAIFQTRLLTWYLSS
ncbi:MAG TPA: prepilin peptidase [Candidatus Binataceae bacterium]|nr:prepilin peptidase [Candidatus Binataceae bacterium]